MPLASTALLFLLGEEGEGGTELCGAESCRDDL